MGMECLLVRHYSAVYRATTSPATCNLSIPQNRAKAAIKDSRMGNCTVEIETNGGWMTIIKKTQSHNFHPAVVSLLSTLKYSMWGFTR